MFLLNPSAWSLAGFITPGREPECRMIGRPLSTANASSIGGTVRPSILAVWWLMTNSNLDACTTGKSAGLCGYQSYSRTERSRHGVRVHQDDGRGWSSENYCKAAQATKARGDDRFWP
jgi:hypothetical protein